MISHYFTRAELHLLRFIANDNVIQTHQHVGDFKEP